MSYAQTLESLVTRHMADQNAISSALNKARRPYSITGLICAGLREKPRPLGDYELDTVHEMSEQCRGTGGAHAFNPDGTWVPFHALASTRDLVAGTPTAGGNLINPRHSNDLTELLRPVSVIAEAGANIIGGMRSGALILPAQDGGSAPQWTAESGTAPQSEPTFKESMIVQHRTVSVEIPFSRQLLKTSSVAVEEVVRREILSAVMAEVDRVALIGNGIEEPLGLLNTPGVPVIAAGENGGAATWEHLTDLEHSVATNARIDRATFAANADVIRKLRRTPRGTGLDPILADENRLLGRRLIGSESVPGNLTKGTGTDLSALILGHFENLIVCFWGPSAIDLIVDGHTRAHQGTVRVIGRCDIGIGVRRPNAFAVMRDLVTTV